MKLGRLSVGSCTLWMANGLLSKSPQRPRGFILMFFGAKKTHSIKSLRSPKNFPAEVLTCLFAYTEAIVFCSRSRSLPPSLPFGADFLCRDWPLLLECCSVPCDHEKIKSLASEINDNESLICAAEAHGVIGHVATALAEVSDPLNSSSLLDLIRERDRKSVV